MPIFEYTCNACSRRFSALVGVVADSKPPACPRCGSDDLKKLVSRFARVRSADDALESLADSADTMDTEDPKAMRRLMKEMSGITEGELSTDEMEAMMDAEESGDASPDFGDTE